jgi:hypothetical protein
MTPAKLMVSNTKYAPRSLSARRPMTQPVIAGATIAARRPTQGDHSSFTVKRAVA